MGRVCRNNSLNSYFSELGCDGISENACLFVYLVAMELFVYGSFKHVNISIPIGCIFCLRLFLSKQHQLSALCVQNCRERDVAPW